MQIKMQQIQRRKKKGKYFPLIWRAARDLDAMVLGWRAVLAGLVVQGLAGAEGTLSSSIPLVSFKASFPGAVSPMVHSSWRACADANPCQECVGISPSQAKGLENISRLDAGSICSAIGLEAFQQFLF